MCTVNKDEEKAECRNVLTSVTDKRIQNALAINDGLQGTGLYREPKGELASGQHTTWRVTPEPFQLDKEMYAFFTELGDHLLRFYEATNRLYARAVRGSLPDWVRAWLEAGKPEQVIDYARMRRFRTAVPAIIRPDVIPTDDGYAITELDSVPGGFGLLAAMTRQYAKVGATGIVGGKDGMVEGFVDAMRALVPNNPHPVVAIIVSDESDAYRGEMEWLAGAATGTGLTAFAIHPRDVQFTEEGLFLPQHITGMAQPMKIDIVYRFFELFDLKNIPKIDLILYAIRKELVVATPPLKHHLEEKLLMALFHHPALEPFWLEQLGRDSVEFLKPLFPKTWVMDPAPLPPHAVIPDLRVGGRIVTDWNQLKDTTQKERELVIKPSGFSEEAWGSRGVRIGHDLPKEEWADAIDEALAAFSHTPHILQEFRKGAGFKLHYYDFASEELVPMRGRARLCPYYFVVDGKTRLGGVLATVTPMDKKLIHGMVDAVMAPCSVAE